MTAIIGGTGGVLDDTFPAGPEPRGNVVVLMSVAIGCQRLLGPTVDCDPWKWTVLTEWRRWRARGVEWPRSTGQRQTTESLRETERQAGSMTSK